MYCICTAYVQNNKKKIIIKCSWQNCITGFNVMVICKASFNHMRTHPKHGCRSSLRVLTLWPTETQNFFRFIPSRSRGLQVVIFLIKVQVNDINGFYNLDSNTTYVVAVKYFTPWGFSILYGRVHFRGQFPHPTQK